MNASSPIDPFSATIPLNPPKDKALVAMRKMSGSSSTTKITSLLESKFVSAICLRNIVYRIQVIGDGSCLAGVLYYPRGRKALPEPTLPCVFQLEHFKGRSPLPSESDQTSTFYPRRRSIYENGTHRGKRAEQ